MIAGVGGAADGGVAGQDGGFVSNADVEGVDEVNGAAAAGVVAAAGDGHR